MRYSVLISLNPNDCLTCLGSVKTIVSGIPEGMSFRIAVPEKFKRSELVSFSRIYFGDSIVEGRFISSDSLYSRLNGGPQSLIHVMNSQQKEVVRAGAQNPDQAIKIIKSFQFLQEPEALLPEKEAEHAWGLIGYSSTSAGPQGACLLNHATNKTLVFHNPPNYSLAETIDTSTIQGVRLYRAWFGDTSGWHVYEKLHEKLVKTLNFTAIRFESAQFVDTSRSALLMSWYRPRRAKYKGQTVDRWEPSYFFVLAQGDSALPIPVRNLDSDLYPCGPFIRRDNGFRLVVEGDTMLPNSPYVLDFVFHKGQLQKKRLRSAPPIPQAVVDSGWQYYSQGRFLIFDAVSWVLDLERLRWFSLQTDGITKAKGETQLHVHCLASSGAGYEGIVADAEANIFCGIWNTQGELIDSWPLNASIKGRKSSLWFDGKHLGWLDDEQRIRLLKLR